MTQPDRPAGIVQKAKRRLVARINRASGRKTDDPDSKVSNKATVEAFAELRRQERVLRFYETARRAGGRVPPALDKNGELKTPGLAQSRAVEAEIRTYAAEDVFFTSLIAGGAIDESILLAVRHLVRAKSIMRARSLAHVLRSREEFTSVGDIAVALVAISDKLPEVAWLLLSKDPIELTMRLAADEYFRVGFIEDSRTACRTLERLLDGEFAAAQSPETWLRIAKWSFGAGEEVLSKRSLDNARQFADSAEDPEFMASVEWLDGWYGKMQAAQLPFEAAAGTIPFAIIDYKQPDEVLTSRNLGDPVQTIASIGHLVRHTGFRFSGDSELVDVAGKLADRVSPNRKIDGDDAEFSLYRIDRDATNYFAIPEKTWTIAFGWYMHPIFGMKFDLPFNSRLRPIFISFHINRPALLTSSVVDYLRTYAPIGCRDWNTVYLLQAAGIPAFFSGCLTSTIDTVYPPADVSHAGGKLFVDTPQTDAGDTFTQVFEGVRRQSLSTNVDQALDLVESYRSTYDTVYTSRLHCYLPARSVGANVEFRPKNPADVRFDGLAFIDDESYESIRQSILGKLDRVLTSIAAGDSENDVYALWREICADDVANARRKAKAFEPMPEPTFSVQDACAAAWQKARVMERTEAGPEGDEINVEFSLDGNLKHHMQVVLESIVSGTSRPIRLFVLCRDHDESDFARVSALFPTVSFVWLPTDDIDYGDIIGMIRHITIATMDRLLLPDLLSDVDKIIHHDLDALCMADLAELYVTDLNGQPIAARTSPQPQSRSGFVGLIAASKRLKKAPSLARELILRSHARHKFDFAGFNAGIIVLNLERMRHDDFCRQFLPYAERFGMNDQEILNVYAGADRVELDHRWNMLPRLEILEAPKVVHWAGDLKPWNRNYVQGQELWIEMESRLASRMCKQAD